MFVCFVYFGQMGVNYLHCPPEFLRTSLYIGQTGINTNLKNLPLVGWVSEKKLDGVGPVDNIPSTD